VEQKLFTADANFDRADVYLTTVLEGYSRSAVKKLCDGGMVTINGKAVKASQPIACNAIISVTLPDPIDYSAKPQDIPLDIVFEDDDMAIINKPQGLTVHAGNGNIDGTLVNALLFNLKSLSGIGGVMRPGIVHRIDKNTSGLLVVAKNDAAHLNLSKQIENKTCHRTYLALLEGNLKQDSGNVTTYIGRSPTDRVKMAVVSPDKGKIAITDYQVVERRDGYTLCKFMLHTGRTHQIRVHAKYLGHPVVGDDVYGIKKQRFNLNGQLLHACKLELDHPRTGERMTFTAPLPDYFKDILKKLGFEFKDDDNV
jgi:23S rRNA pseudouridine1911/1915/1917 synthase